MGPHEHIAPTDTPAATPPPKNSSSATPAVDPAARPASQTWEAVPLADPPGQFVWVWWKPPNWPHGLVLRIPDETRQADPAGNSPALRQLLHAAGIALAAVSTWQHYGGEYPADDGASPYLDQPISAPPAGTDPNIYVAFKQPVATPAPRPPATRAPQPPATPAPQPVARAPQPLPPQEMSVSEILENMEADWIVSQRTEQRLAIVRKQLAEMQARLNSLNRDLSPDERRYADRQDMNDWQEARRWMRDVSANLSRFIKDYDVGELHSAAKRDWFEQTYRQFIHPRQPFEGMQQAQRAYESQRKMVQVLLTNMNNALTAAVQDGERRAQQVLSRITTKVRQSQRKP